MVLDEKEFRKCLESMDSLNLSQADVDVLMCGADLNEDGKISYPEFITLSYSRLLHFARESALKEWVK